MRERIIEVGGSLALVVLGTGILWFWWCILP